jgi:hypothetical protein
MQQYITDNNLPNKSSDTSTTVLLEMPSPSSSSLLTLSAINSSFNALSDEWVLVVAFNVIVNKHQNIVRGNG